jgi:hypothetical protein
VENSIQETPSDRIGKISPWMNDQTILREFLGNGRHFIPEKLNIEPANISDITEDKKYPRTLSWLTEFKRQ